jgi:hypothetical protein
MLVAARCGSCKVKEYINYIFTKEINMVPKFNIMEITYE